MNLTTKKNILKSKNAPNYKRIYTDILDIKFPEKKGDCEKLLNKLVLSDLDILSLNKMIFGHIPDLNTRQIFRSYSKSSILQILDYQKKHKLNNQELARHFNLSRNSVTKWRRLFLK
ncbi:helix-turn-helix domain-containing protein [Chryseobacterium joostei]|uniref:helix-turn-helix domain-containing protein n=1 Tax=Chryseobacterium joostei TaxID=112234 RepID=UPI003D0DAAE2